MDSQRGQAMKLIMTGNSILATEFSAHVPGLNVLPASDVLEGAKRCAKEIAERSGPVIALAKQAILAGTCFSVLSQAQRGSKTNADEEIAESGLDGGLEVERGLYYSSFDLQDKNEGISAFLEKRKPKWTHQ